jgi:protein-tyrosine phosphatase
MGALIQINADSVIGTTGFKDKSFCKKLIKNGWINIVASDAHSLNLRANHMHQAYDYVATKYGSDYAKLLFYKNPIKFIDG